jgi:hypothetical protein
VRFNRSRFAAVVIFAVLGLSTASAGAIYFTGDGTGEVAYSTWNIPFGFFGSFYDYFTVSDACSGGSCVAASTPGGTPLGNFGLSVAGNYFVSNQGNGITAELIDTNSVYYEQIVPFDSPGFNIVMSSPTGGPYLLEGTVTAIGVYDTIVSSDATIEFDITNATSQVIAGLPSTVYLDVSGTATEPITTFSFTASPSGTLINPFDIDWSASLSDTSLLNSPAPTGAPEPSAWLLAAGGLVCLGARRLIRGA